MPVEIPRPDFTDKEVHVQLLRDLNDHLLEAMKALSDEEWHVVRKAKFGASTPLEAIGRIVYHTGIHSGQISLI